MSRGVGSWSEWVSAFAFFVAGAFPLYNIDAYGHFAQGRQIADLGRVPVVDTFSFWKPTPQPWSNYEWGYDLVTWLLYDSLGPNALIVIKCLLLAALGFILVLLAQRLGQGAAPAAPLAAAILIAVTPLARLRFTVRPQIIGLVLPAVLLLGISALYSDRASARAKRWIVAALAVLHLGWVNMHGSHLLGLLITGLFLVFAFRTVAFRPLLALLALQLAATACTPFGIDIVADAIAHVFVPEYREVVIEWAPWSPAHPLYLLIGPLVAAVLVVVAMRPVTRSGRFGLAYGVLCVLLSIMAFRSMRFVAHQLLFTAPFIAAGLSQQSWAKGVQGIAPLLVVLAFLVSVVVAPRLEPFVPFGFGEPRLGHAFAAAEVINEHVDEPRILAPIQDAWPLMFAVPEGRFLVDGRVPFYGPAFVREVTNSFSDPTTFAALLAKYDVDTVVVDHIRKGQAPAVEYLWRSPDWVLAYVQDRQSLFIRSDKASHGLKGLKILGPGYRVGRILDPKTSPEELRLEIEWLKRHPQSDAVLAWVEGLAHLRPLARDAGRAGIRLAQPGEERAAARRAYATLSDASSVYRGFPSIELYRAMAAAAACDAAQAREALELAKYKGETRATSLLAIEIALRMGNEEERAAAREHVGRLSTHAQSGSDSWVAAIARDIDVRCP